MKRATILEYLYHYQLLNILYPISENGAQRTY